MNKKRLQSAYEKNDKYPENLIHKSVSGHYVRSKSEALIDSVLYKNRLAYYVWLRNCKFAYVYHAMSAGEMLGMYDTLHEADITKFVAAVDYVIDLHYNQTDKNA